MDCFGLDILIKYSINTFYLFIYIAQKNTYFKLFYLGRLMENLDDPYTFKHYKRLIKLSFREWKFIIKKLSY